MRNTYPDYRVKRINIFDINIKPKDRKIIDDFLKMCSGSAGESKVRNIERTMIQIVDVSQTSLDKWNLNTLRDFLAVLNKSDKLNSTKNDIKKVLKRFLKEYYEDWNTRFKGLRDNGMKQQNEVNQLRLNPTTMIKDNEIELLIKGCENFKWRAWIHTSYETAGRPGEILNLKWKDVDLDNKKIKLFSSKNNTIRVIPIKDCVIPLKQYKQEYPFPDVKPNDYVFVSPTDRTKPLSHNAMYDYFESLSKKTIKRSVSPYLFRHTRLSFLHKKLSPKSYQMYADHSIATAVKHYSHLGADDLREEMYEKIFNIEEITKEQKNEYEERLEHLEKKIELLQKGNLLREVAIIKTFLQIKDLTPTEKKKALELKERYDKLIKNE